MGREGQSPGGEAKHTPCHTRARATRRNLGRSDRGRLSGFREPGRAAGRLDLLVAGAVLGPFGAGFLMASPSASPDADIPAYQASVGRVARRK